ncbi:proton-conducting transporter transmembrane domain-containing protein [Thermococcus sp.]
MEPVAYILILPLTAAIISLVSESLAGLFTPVLSLATAVVSADMLMRGYTVSNGTFHADWYSIVTVSMISWLYFFASLSSLHYVKRVERPFFRLSLYWALLSLFALSMIFTAVVSNLGWMWIGLEGTTIVSALLIITDGKKRNVEGAWRYMIIASAGLGIAFLSVVVAYSSAGTLDITRLTLPEKTAVLVSLLGIIGFGTKAGIFPMHSWLPDAHGSAPSPVSAMLSGTLLPTALLVYMRIFHAATEVTSKPVYPALAAGILTIMVASVLMASQRFLKRLLAYSSMDVMGIALTGIALSYYHPQLLRLVFILLAVHALSKGALFISGGSLVRAYGTHEIEEIGGVLSSTRLTGYTFALSALSVTGAPPFATFPAELVVVGSAFIYSRWWALLTGTGILLSFLALNWHSMRMVFGEERNVELSLREEAVPFVMMLVALGISLYVWYLMAEGGLIL